MPLLTDGGISTIADLQGYDASLLEVAKVEGIDLTRKLRNAEEEVTLRVKQFVLVNGLAGQIGLGGGEIALGKVVVTSGLKRWHALETLANVYADAYYGQLNDRYEKKWRHFQAMAEGAASLLFGTGVGCVSDPVRKPEGVEVSMSGVAGAQATYFVSVAWRNPAGVAGAPSDTAIYATEGPQTIRVRPRGSAPAEWTFDVYAGGADDQLTRQTATPVATGQFWTMPGAGLVNGDAPGSGQPAEFYLRRGGTILRG